MFQFMQELLITPKPEANKMPLEKNKRRFFLGLRDGRLYYLIVEEGKTAIDKNDIEVHNYNIVPINNNTMRNFKFPSKQKERL